MLGLAKLLPTIVLAFAVVGCGQPRHSASSLPEPMHNPKTAADILDNYLFGGMLRVLQGLGGPTVDRVRVWTADPLRVAIFAPEEDGAVVVAMLNRYAELSGRGYVLTRDDSDIVFVVQRKFSDIDLERAVFEDTDIGYRVSDSWDNDSEHLTRETVSHYAKGNSDMPDYFQGVDNEFSVTYLYGTPPPGRPFDMPAVLVLIDTPAEPGDAQLHQGLYHHVGGILMPHALISDDDPHYNFFDPDAPAETRRALRAYFAAGLTPGMTRAQAMERIRTELAKMP